LCPRDAPTGRPESPTERYLWMETHRTFSLDRVPLHLAHSPQSEERYFWMGTHRTFSPDRDTRHLFRKMSVPEEQVRSSQSEERYLRMGTHSTFSSDRFPQSEERYLRMRTHWPFSWIGFPYTYSGNSGKCLFIFLRVSFIFFSYDPTLF